MWLNYLYTHGFIDNPSPACGVIAEYAVNIWGWQGLDYDYNSQTQTWEFNPEWPQPPIQDPSNAYLTFRALYPPEIAGVMNNYAVGWGSYEANCWPSPTAAVESEAWKVAWRSQPSAVAVNMINLNDGNNAWHCMLMVGCTSNIAPDDDSALIYGVWVQDPGGWFTNYPSYVSSDVWADKYYMQWSGGGAGGAPDYSYGSLPAGWWDVEDPSPGDPPHNTTPSGELAPPTKPTGQVLSPDQALALADDGLRRHMLTLTGPIAPYLKDAKRGQPVYVTALDSTFGDYYIIPYIRDGKVSAAVTVDVQTGEFEGASACTTDLTTLPRIGQLVVGAALQSARGIAAADATLVWGLCGEATSPYTPFWRVHGQDGCTYYVTQDGIVHDSLTGRR
jgi:hypothetical protein